MALKYIFTACRRSVVLFLAIKQPRSVCWRSHVFTTCMFMLHISYAVLESILSRCWFYACYSSHKRNSRSPAFHFAINYDWKMKNKKAHTNCLSIMACPYLVLFLRRMLYLYNTWLFIKCFLWFKTTLPQPVSSKLQRHSPTLYWACDYLSMLGRKWNHVGKRDLTRGIN